MIELVPPSPEHVAYVAEHMRAEDREEAYAAAGLSPLTALEWSVRMSDPCHVALSDGVPFCIFGVVPQSMLSSAGVPWLLGTPQIEQIRIAFIRRNRKVVRTWLDRFDELHNYVDARNTKSIAWLKWLGFTLAAAEPYGFAGLPFHYFSMGRS